MDISASPSQRKRDGILVWKGNTGGPARRKHRLLHRLKAQNLGGNCPAQRRGEKGMAEGEETRPKDPP